MEGLQDAGKSLRNGNQMDSDRLSNLPDPIIYHILSLMDTKYAVRTCVLSKKWILRWTEIHSLNFNTESFDCMWKFEKFVRHVLLKRRQFSLSRLSYLSRSEGSESVATRISNYAASHNVEEFETDSYLVSLQLSKLKSLRILKLTCRLISNYTHFASSLTTLCLTGVMFDHPCSSSDVFSSCLMLENLFLNEWEVTRLDNLNVSAPQLVNLTISCLNSFPLYKTSTLVISAPTLKFLDFSGTYVKLSGIDECPVLEKVNIQVFRNAFTMAEDRKQEHALDLQRMAERLSHVKSVNISWNFSQTCREFHIGSSWTIS